MLIAWFKEEILTGDIFYTGDIFTQANRLILKLRTDKMFQNSF